MLVRAVLTDFDGPIVDSYHEGLRRVELLCSLFGFDFTTGDRVALKNNWGLPGRELLLRSVEAIRDEATADQVYTSWITHDQNRAYDLVPDARSVLVWLKMHNAFPTACLTSRDADDAEETFRIMDIAQYFDIVSAKQEIDGEVIRKPDPRVIEPVFARFQEIADDASLPDEHRRRYDGITPEDCIYVGDTRSDVLAGWSYGMGATLVVLNGPIASTQIQELHEDPEIQKQFAGRRLQFSEMIRDIGGVVDWLEANHEAPLSPYRRVS